MTLAFYLSGHGFGHASREVEVMNVIGLRRPDARLVVRTAVSPELLARTLRVPYDLRPGPCDSGIVQRSSVEHDDERTVEEAAAFHRDWTARVAREAAALASDRPAVIIGDIPPLAFDVARLLSVPSVAIANFTWDWIYEAHPGFDRATGVLDIIRAAYRHASVALRLPLSGGFEPMAVVRSLPFIARQPTRERADTRRHFGLDASRPVALLSFGGYGLPALDLAGLDCLDTWTIVTTDRVTRAHPRGLPPDVIRLDERLFVESPYRYEDLVAAADVAVTKPGYGIIADCIAAGTAMLYTSRGAFREYDVLVEALPRYLRARYIGHADLLAGRWKAALDGLMASAAPPERPDTRGAAIAADAVLEVAERAGD